MSEPERRSAPPAADPGPASPRVLAATRIVALVIIPFLVVAAILLLAVPERSGELFAWAIAPPMSAALLASAYVGGIWFFAAVALGRRTHEVRHGLPAVAVFAGALLFATLLHLDRFSSNLSFAAWITLYATTPFAAAALAVVERRRDPGTAQRSDVLLPASVRLGLVLIGGAALLTGIAMFAFPQAAADVWAWPLTPLTAQVTAATLTLPGVVSLAVVRDPRWSAIRIVIQAQLVSLAAIAVSMAVHRADLRWDRPATTGFVALIAAAIVAYAALTVWAARRARGR